MIVHVSSSPEGGAGVAARRLHDGLRQHGADSHFVSAVGQSDDHRNYEVLPRRQLSLWKRIGRKFGCYPTQHDAWEHQAEELDCVNVFTSSVESDSTLLSSSTVQSASIINLHWTAGVLPWKDFFATVKCPVVWTLHDMNPFMGIFHYATDKARGSKPACEFDDRVAQQKKALLNGHRPTIVAPSRWLSQKAQQSELFHDFAHQHIPYGLDTNVFKPYDQTCARSVFNLPSNRKLMLIVAERLDDHRKGFDLLVEAVQGIDAKLLAEWDLVAIGHGKVPVSNIKCHHTGVIADERLMALAYSAADMTVIASREDNLPNVILESLSCGTPVVGTPAGGIPEPIVSDRDGIVADTVSASSLAAAISRAVSLDFQRGRIAVAAHDRYRLAVTASRYLSLYQSIELARNPD